jgi:hypothetical protein
MRLNTLLHLVPRLIMSGAISKPLLYPFMVHAGKTLLLPYTCGVSSTFLSVDLSIKDREI